MRFDKRVRTGASPLGSRQESNVMITRRRMLAASGGLAAMVAAERASAETAAARTEARNAMMEIKRNGSQPSGKGPADYFTGAVRVDPLGAGSGARHRRERHL